MTAPGEPSTSLKSLLVAMADDELVLGHRISEWTGHGPILEEDIALSNIAQDEIGHALVWLTLAEPFTGSSPDWMGFVRPWDAFTSCHFVAYSKGDFAYTVVRQFLFDAAEQVRLRALTTSSYQPLREAAAKILREEEYHLLHTRGLVERLGPATEESHRRMQSALDDALPQALGIFEELPGEDDLVKTGVMPSNTTMRDAWLASVTPVLQQATLRVPAVMTEIGSFSTHFGGRAGHQVSELRQLVGDLQSVYQLAPNGAW